MGILTLEDETTMLPSHIGHQSPSEVKPHPRTTETSTALLHHPKTRVFIVKLKLFLEVTIKTPTLSFCGDHLKMV
jgi:hypothetical protein